MGMVHTWNNFIAPLYVISAYTSVSMKEKRSRNDCFTQKRCDIFYKQRKLLTTTAQ